MRDSVKIRVVKTGFTEVIQIDLHGTDRGEDPAFRQSQFTRPHGANLKASERLLGDVFCKARNTLPMNANPKPEPIPPVGPTPVTRIRNLGPAMARHLEQAGITSAEQVRALGPDATYQFVLTVGVKAHFIAYYALVMGLQGRPWNDLSPDEKTKLRKRFDGIVAAHKASSSRQMGDLPSDLAWALDEIGIKPATG